MIDFKITDIGRKNLLGIRKLRHSIRDGITLGFYEIGKKLNRDIVRSIVDDPKTGRTYIRYLNGRRIVHRASAPGEPPANFTGKLKRSVGYRIRKGGYEMIVGAGSDKVKYARSLELGTSKVKARPYLRPQINKNAKFIIEFIHQGINKKIGKGVD